MRLEPAYRNALKLWFEFMKLSLDPVDEEVVDRIKPWDKQVWAHIAPLSGEKFSSWLKRCRGALERGREYPIVVHRTRAEMNNHWIDGDPDIHLSIDPAYTRTEILAAIEQLLVRRRVKSGQGRADEVRQRADFQPNAVFSPSALQKTLNVWLAYEKGVRLGRPPSNLQLGEDVLELKVVETKHGSNRASVEANVARHKRRARELIISVRYGRFPDPTKPANANAE